MWTSSFSDFAKKAQEAAELAAKTAESLNTAAGSSIFNLDSMLDGEETIDSPQNINQERKVEVDETGPLEVISEQERVISTSDKEVKHPHGNDTDNIEAVVSDEWDFDDETHVVEETDTDDQHHHEHVQHSLRVGQDDSPQDDSSNNDPSLMNDMMDHSPLSTSSLQSQEGGDISNQESNKEDAQHITETMDSPPLEPLEQNMNPSDEAETNAVLHEPQSNYTEMAENEDVRDGSFHQDESSNNQVSITDDAFDPVDAKSSMNESNHANEVPIVTSDLENDIDSDHDKNDDANLESNDTNVPLESCPKLPDSDSSSSSHPTSEIEIMEDVVDSSEDEMKIESEDMPLNGNGNGNVGVDNIDDKEAIDEISSKNKETIGNEILDDQHAADTDDEMDNVPFVEDPHTNSPMDNDDVPFVEDPPTNSPIDAYMENVKVATIHDSTSKIEDGLSKKSEEMESSPDVDQIHTSNKSNSFTHEEENEMNTSMMDSTNKIDSEAEDLNALNDMYDDSENDSKNESKEIQTPSEVSNVTNSNQAAPQYAIEKFMSQLERIHKEHELELQDMEKKHMSHMEELKEKLRIAESKQSKSAISKQSIANHDKCLKELRELEKNFLQQLQQKDEMIVQIKDQKTLLEQRIREMVEESDNLNSTLEARKGDINQIQQSKSKIEELTLALEKSQSDFKSSQEAYSTLKERVKDVATELKERRVECRKLSATINDMTSQNASLESAKNDFEAKANRLSVLVQSKDEEIENLTTAITNLRMELSQKEKQLIDTGSIGNKALMEYKKKAQASLSIANARAATANQAREDAEIDAANARAEAENAVKELEKVKAEKEAIVHNKHAELQEIYKTVSSKEQEVTSLLKQVSELNAELSLAKISVDESQNHCDELVEEWNKKLADIEKERERSHNLSQDLALTKIKNDELNREVAFLKEELEERATKAFMEKQNDTSRDMLAVPNGTLHNELKSQTDLGGSDGTIYLLQEELKASNEAIEELKEALANALSNNPISSGLDYSSPAVSSPDPDHSESNPLFFALEKQSELKLARDEIARLVGLLGEAEFSKSDALEELEEMRQKMNEAESRLRRYEKLGPAAKSTLSGGNLNRKAFDSKLSSHSDSAANLEYLKNVIFRFMKSTTLNEKKALIPVIAAVLELTPDEQILALQSIEKSAGISGVGTSLIENVQSKGLAGLFG